MTTTTSSSCPSIGYGSCNYRSDDNEEIHLLFPKNNNVDDDNDNDNDNDNGNGESSSFSATINNVIGTATSNPSTSTASLVITLLLVSLSVLALSLSLFSAGDDKYLTSSSSLTMLVHHTSSSSSSSSATIATATMAAETNINENVEERSKNAIVEKIVYIIRHGEKHWDPKNETAYKYACLSKKGYARANRLVSVFADAESTTTTSPTTDDNNNDDNHLITPNGLFSFNYDNDLDCRDVSDGIYRTQATLHPLSNALQIPVNNITGSKPDLCGFGTIDDAPTDTVNDSNDGNNYYNHKVCHHPSLEGSTHDFGMCCNIGAAEAIRNKLFENENVSSSVLVSWEHANIGFLAEALMMNDKDNKIGERDITIGEFISTDPEFIKLLFWPDVQFDKIFALYFDPQTQEYTKIDTTTLTQGFDSFNEI